MSTRATPPTMAGAVAMAGAVEHEAQQKQHEGEMRTRLVA